MLARLDQVSAAAAIGCNRSQPNASTDCALHKLLVLQSLTEPHKSARAIWGTTMIFENLSVTRLILHEVFKRSLSFQDQAFVSAAEHSSGL
jgi:hypothetical protein